MNKEWFQGLSVIETERKTIFPYWLIAILLIIFFLIPGLAHSKPVLKAEAKGVVIIVYDEPCTHMDSVSNLPMRATWTQEGKVYDGCVGSFPAFGVAAFWFDDKSVAVIPLDAFKRLIEA